jgi:hypothetical protein
VKRSNFTLIELVVAIAILILVAGIVGVSGSAFYQGYERSLRVTGKLKEYMAIDNLMDTHIRNMIPFDWKDEDGNVRLLFDGEENSIFFTTLRRSYGDTPGALLFVRVFVEDEQLIAEYSIYPRLPWLEDGDESMPYTREVIAENVRLVTFSYAEESTETEGDVEFLDEYREEDNVSLPLAILMKVEFTDGTTEQWLRRVAGTSRDSTFGLRTGPDANVGNDSAEDENSGGESSGGTSSGRRPAGGGGANRPAAPITPGRQGGGRQ